MTPRPASAAITIADPHSDDDRFHDECGVFGIWGHEDAAHIAALGLHALQHRGQEAAGIVTFDGSSFHSHRALGLVEDAFAPSAVMDSLSGNAAVGHVRYATTGATVLRNVQPLFADLAAGGFAVGHNGNLTNARTLRRELVARGCLFQSTSDTEVIIHLLAISREPDLESRLVDALAQVQGAYSLVALSNTGLIGVRDPLGVRPLVIGRIGARYVLASETCALDIIGAQFERAVTPGEVVVIGDHGLRSLRPWGTRQPKFCIFEYIYFARPDSEAEGTSIYDLRKRIGAELARESTVAADVVVPVPDSGVPAAIGYSQVAGLPFELGIVRNHYVGRTFIQPTDSHRHLGVKLKHNANRGFLSGKRVILVDDSIVRGTTSRKIVDMVRNAGAQEVHMRISSPPTTNPCFYGIDTPEKEQLLAARHDVAAMARVIGVDSLAFISMDGLYRAIAGQPRDPAAPQFCDACFSGDYPIPLVDHDDTAAPQQMSFLTEPGA